MLSIYILDVLYLFNNHLDRRSSRVRLFRSRRGALGPFRVRPFRQSPLERERLVALDSSGAAAELWDLFARAPSDRALWSVLCVLRVLCVLCVVCVVCVC